MDEAKAAMCCRASQLKKAREDFFLGKENSSEATASKMDQPAMVATIGEEKEGSSAEETTVCQGRERKTGAIPKTMK